MADMKWSPEDWARLGVHLRKARERQGYSRKRLSDLSGVSEKSIQLAEEGRVPTRWPKSIQILARVLNWDAGSVQQVLDGGEPLWVNPLFNLPGDGASVVDKSTSDSLRPGQSTASKAIPSPGVRSYEDVELVHSGHLAQDVFMRQARRWRTIRGMSVEDLIGKIGDAVDLTADDVRRLEDGMRLLRMAEAKAIANALDTTVDWLLGSGFSEDSPEEMRWPPNDRELEAEANAVMRRIGEVGMRVNAAYQQMTVAQQRMEEARQEKSMAEAMLQSVMAQQREMEKHHQYLLGRIDSLRAARGEQTAIEIVPVFEEDE